MYEGVTQASGLSVFVDNTCHRLEGPCHESPLTQGFGEQPLPRGFKTPEKCDLSTHFTRSFPDQKKFLRLAHFQDPGSQSWHKQEGMG